MFNFFKKKKPVEVHVEVFQFAYRIMPHLTPCRYCKRYDDQVKFLNSDGLKGPYHPFCHSEVLRSVRDELARRMNNWK